MGPLEEMSVPLHQMGVARFAGLGVDAGSPLGSLRAILQVRRAGDRGFADVQLSAESGLLVVGSESPTARLRVAVPPGTYQLKFFVGDLPVQASPSGALGAGLGPAGSATVQLAGGVVRLGAPFRMSARVDWGRTRQVLSTPGVCSADEFRLVPDFALAYSAGGDAAWDWTVYGSGSDALEAFYAGLESPGTLVTSPARPARLLRAWLMWCAMTAVLLLALSVGLGVGWAVSAGPVARRPAPGARRGAISPLLGDAVAVRRAADGRL